MSDSSDDEESWRNSVIFDWTAEPELEFMRWESAVQKRLRRIHKDCRRTYLHSWLGYGRVELNCNDTDGPKEIMAKLEKYCEKRTNIYTHRREINEYKQEEDESFRDFYVRLITKIMFVSL